MNKKKIVAVFLSLLFVLAIPMAPAAAGPGDGRPAGAAYSYDEVMGALLLKPFTLVASFSDRTVNNIKVSERAVSFLWDKDTGAFAPVETTAERIIGNFVQLRDVTGDGIADGLLIVSRADSKRYWDSGQYRDDSFADEEAFSKAQSWRIPFGQRLLDEYGVDGAVVDYSNIVDYADLQGSTYWPLHDYYRAETGGSLSILTGFRTTQQATGWTCGPTSALMVLDWFGKRGDLNEQDLAALRNHPRQTGATSLQQMINIFENLNALYDQGAGQWGKWTILSSYDFVEEDNYQITKAEDEKYNLMAVEELMDGSLFRELLSAGIPILIGWNSFGGHWQVIIGYDDMGSEDTKDHVLILADPYDTTDHQNDGYNIQSLERFVYDWSAGFDPDFEHGIFVAAVPENWEYARKRGEGITAYKEGYDGNGTDGRKLDYGRTAEDIETYYPDTPWRGDNGLAGAATGGYERVPNDYVNVSPYYAHYNYYEWKNGPSPVGGGNLIILEQFRTQQQTTEWTCGPTSALMAIEWYFANPWLPRLPGSPLTEINLARLRGEDRQAPGATSLDDMKHIFDSLNENENYLQVMADANGWKTLKKWAYLSTDDLDEDGCITDEKGVEHYLEYGAADDGLIPYYLSLGYPVLIGWNEWGGHWQVVIGYDDLGTEETQDDVLILADPYDTTDHNQDGYYLESFERLVYGWVSDFDPRGENVFFIPYLVDTTIPTK